MPLKVDFRRRIVVATVAAALGACAAGHPVHNVDRAAIEATKPNLTLDDISKAVVRAGTQLGWQMTPDRAGHVLGRLAVRAHVAVVDVDYDRESYSIKYKDSTNLEYNGGTIHKTYNGWIERLDSAIRVQLITL